MSEQMKKLIIGTREFEVVDSAAREDITLLKNYVTPEMFGAVGDGITDDSAALNNMFSDEGNNYIFIPAKTYFCATDILLGTTDNNVVGSGEYESIIKLGEGAKFTIKGNTVYGLNVQAVSAIFTGNKSFV